MPGCTGRQTGIINWWFRPGTNANSLAVPVLMRISSGYNGILAVAHFLVVTEESDPCPFQRRDL